MTKELDVIQTKRLIFRGIDESDAMNIVGWRSDYNVYKYFKTPHMITLEEHLKWYHNNYVYDENRYDWICIEKCKKEKIGVFGLSFKDGGAEINYILAPKAQHKGYATEAAEGLITYAFEQKRVAYIYAEIHKDNFSSIRFIQKLNFKFQNCKGDFVIYCKTKN